MAGARHRWQIARARASAASAGRGRLGHPQQPHDHQRDLVLVGAAVAGHRRLDLARRVQGHRQAAPRGADDRDRAGLRGAHHGPHVVLAEHPLHRHRVGLVLGQPALDLLLDRQQPGRRCPASASVRTTPTATSVGGRPGTPSTTPRPHRVRPGSMPRTRDGGARQYAVTVTPGHRAPQSGSSASEHLFANPTAPRPAREPPCGRVMTDGCAGHRGGGGKAGGGGESGGGKLLTGALEMVNLRINLRLKSRPYWWVAGADVRRRPSWH